jgi:hypothetical protein
VKITSDYNPMWPDEFEVIRSSLLEILGPLALRIDHIGSTQPTPGLILPEVWDEIYARSFDLTPPAQDFAKMPCIFIEL